MCAAMAFAILGATSVIAAGTCDKKCPAKCEQKCDKKTCGCKDCKCANGECKAQPAAKK